MRSAASSAFSSNGDSTGGVPLGGTTRFCCGSILKAERGISGSSTCLTQTTICMFPNPLETELPWVHHVVRVEDPLHFSHRYDILCVLVADHVRPHSIGSGEEGALVHQGPACLLQGSLRPCHFHLIIC